MVCSNCCHQHIPWFVMEWLLESRLEKFLHGPLVKNEQKEVVVHHLQSKDIVILQIGS